MAAPSPSAAYMEAIQARRSYYKITNTSPIADAAIEALVRDAVVSTPTAFNTQQARAVVLLKADHAEFWDMVLEVLQPHLASDEARAATGARIAGFRAGYGTVLFLDDPAPMAARQAKMPQYADRFPGWAAHSSGMLQHIVWTLLEAHGFGASLQHYNPLVDVRAKARWNIPADWHLHAMMPFGALAEPAKAPLQGKEVVPVEERVFVHGK